MAHERIKILLLGYDDTTLSGHVFSHYKLLPEYKFDKRIVVLASCKEKKDYAFYSITKKLFPRIKFKLYRIYMTLLQTVASCSLIARNDRRKEFCFFRSEYSSVTGKKILAKNPDFVPDVIGIYWTAGFLYSKTIRELYELTGAKILFVFVDMAHLTGGCHYPNECNGYLYGCHNCPALSYGKRLAEIQMNSKLKHWKGLPKIVYGTKSDCELAKESPVFKDAYFISRISTPKVTVTNTIEARKKWQIEPGRFVILLGANSLDDTRKGLKYAIEAINKFAEYKSNLSLFLLGNQTSLMIQRLGISPSISIISPGFLSLDDLFMAYCASDCHISSSVADSGPMMVNYSIACGTPVVSFNVGVARDIVLHKETGYIARYKDSEDLVRGLDWMYQLDVCSKIKMKRRCLSLMEELKKQKPYYDVLYDYIIDNRNKRNVV